MIIMKIVIMEELSVPNRSCWSGCGSMWSVSLPHFRGTPCSFLHLNVIWFDFTYLFPFILYVFVFWHGWMVDSRPIPSTFSHYYFILSLSSFRYFPPLQFLDFGLPVCQSSWVAQTEYLVLDPPGTHVPDLTLVLVGSWPVSWRVTLMDSR